MRVVWTACLLALGACCVPLALQGQDCDDRVCVVARRSGASVNIYVENRLPADVTVRIVLDAENMAAEVDFPYTATYPGRAVVRAFSAWPRERGVPWRYRYHYAWRMGRAGARHDDTYAYALPFEPGTAHRVGQDADGGFTHREKHAIDFDLPEGTPVYAARGGTVAEAIDTYAEGGLHDWLKGKSNRILIQHDDGTIGVYAHLMPRGARVQTGEVVARGQVIGRSGNTGYSSGPHLHFEVYRITEDLQQETIPVKFRVQNGRVVVLRRGGVYTAVR